MDIDTQAPNDVEQVNPTQVNFGQGADTQALDEGQVNSEINSWESDKRFATHWGQDPNKMYESLRYHEKRQGDFDTQINEYKKQIDELQKYKNDYTAIEELFGNEKIGPELRNVIEKYSQQESQETQQPIENLDPRLDELLSWKKNIENHAINYYQQQIRDSEFKKIDELADKFQISYDKDQFIDYMTKSNVPQEMWFNNFKAQAFEQVMAKHGAKAAEQALAKSAYTQSYPSGNSKANNAQSRVSNMSDYVAALDAIMSRQQ